NVFAHVHEDVQVESTNAQAILQSLYQKRRRDSWSVKKLIQLAYASASSAIGNPDGMPKKIMQTCSMKISILENTLKIDCRMQLFPRTKSNEQLTASTIRFKLKNQAGLSVKAVRKLKQCVNR